MNEIIISRRVPQRWELLWKGACQIGRHSGLLLLLCAFVLKYCFHPSATRFQSVGMSVRPAEQQPMCRPPFIPTGDQCRVFLYSPFSAHFLYSRLSILPTKMPLFFDLFCPCASRFFEWWIRGGPNHKWSLSCLHLSGPLWCEQSENIGKTLNAKNNHPNYRHTLNLKYLIELKFTFNCFSHGLTVRFSFD